MTALQRALPEEVVRYGCAVEAVQETRGRESVGVKVTVKGQGGKEEVEGDALILADGIFSRYRNSCAC